MVGESEADLVSHLTKGDLDGVEGQEADLMSEISQGGGDLVGVGDQKS